jgi:arylsulfatase A-like enzyme
MDRRDFLKAVTVIGVSSLTGGCSFTANVEKQAKPNIIFCLVDDMGKEGVSCYNTGKPNLTPVIDSLAADGIKFDNFYAMPQCTPTRVAFLTGQYPFRNGWVNHYDVPRWNLKGFSPKTNPCVGNVVKSAGYRTCIAGKWQINDFRDEPNILNECGFDEYCMWTGGESKNPPSNRRYWDAYIHTKDGSKTYKGKYGPDVFTDFIVDFIEQNKSEPMFIYYPMVLRHGPIEKQPTGVSPEEYIDHLVGRIVASVEKNGIRDNTIIIFATDNGKHKGKTTELGVCVPLVVSCPGIVPKGVVTDALVDITDFLATFAELSGAKLPGQYTYDGRSFASFITGNSADSSRRWIMAMGGHPCVRPKKGQGPFDGKNKHPYRDRVIRDKRYKVYVNTQGKIDKLIDLKADPKEKNNIINTKDQKALSALSKFERVVTGFPDKDNNPRYY